MTRRSYYEISGGPADVGYTLPKQDRPFRLLSLTCSFISPAVTGNTRVPALQFGHGGVQLLGEYPASSQGDGGEQTVTWGPGLNGLQITATGHTSTTAAIPAQTVIDSNDTVEVFLIAGDAGDTIGTIGFVLEFYDDAPRRR